MKHGIARRQEGGSVRVVVCREGQGMRISVPDTGGGFVDEAESAEHSGISLKNTSRRLELCYGGASKLEIERSATETRVGFWALFQTVKTGEGDGVRLPAIPAR